MSVMGPGTIVRKGGMAEFHWPHLRQLQQREHRLLRELFNRSSHKAQSLGVSKNSLLHKVDCVPNQRNCRNHLASTSKNMWFCSGFRFERFGVTLEPGCCGDGAAKCWVLQGAMRSCHLEFRSVWRDVRGDFSPWCCGPMSFGRRLCPLPLGVDGMGTRRKEQCLSRVLVSCRKADLLWQAP